MSFTKIKNDDSDEWYIADLNELREELEGLYPCMQIIADYLRNNRKNRNMPLRGYHSDILYVWCSLTIAADCAFAVTPDAPMNYYYDEKISYQEFKNSDSMMKFDSDDYDDDDDYDSGDDYDTDDEDDSDDEDEGEYDIDELVNKLAEAITENIMNSIVGQDVLDIKQKDNKLIFDDAFSVELPDGIEFSPETDEEYATLTGFGDENDIMLTIRALDADGLEALKVVIEGNMAEDDDDGECDYLMLFDDEDTEIAIFIQASGSAFEMEYNIIPMIRVDKHSYRFQANYSRSGFGLGDALKWDIESFCRIFDNIKVKDSRKCIRPEINKAKLNKIIDKILNMNDYDDSALGEHCFEDTPAIVCDDWVITVPAGYIFSTDEEIVGHRAIFLGLDDGTFDLSAPFGSTVNFSVIMPDEEGFLGEPLDSLDMGRIVYRTLYMFYGKTKPLYRHLSPSIIKHCQIGVESPFKLVEIRKSASFRCSQKSQILRNPVEIW